MNKIFFRLSLLLFSVVIVGCSNDDDNQNNNNDNTTSADQTTQIMEEGTWRITNFIDSGDDETADFNGYAFTFLANGTVNAVKGNETVSGTWSITDDNSNSSSDDDGNSSDDDDFNLFFPVPDTNKFEDLNDDWDFVSISNTKIELIDISGGNGGTDLLTFERN